MHIYICVYIYIKEPGTPESIQLDSGLSVRYCVANVLLMCC